MMNRICFVLPSAYHLFAKKDGLIGGAEVNFYYLATELAHKEEYSVEFLVGDFEQNNVEEIDNVRLIKIKHLNFDIYNKLYHQFTWRYFLIKSILTNPSDIYITTTISFYFLYLAFLVKFIKRKKLVFRVASDFDVNGFFTNNNGLRGKLFKLLLKKVDKIVCQNQNQKELLLKTERLNACVIPNGFPVNNIETIDTKRDSILWVGKSDANKNPMLFIKMVHLFPDEKFVMIINGNNSIKQNIMNECKDLPNLKIIDFVSFFEIDSFFKRAKCFVNTSDIEGFPNTFIQAGLNGCPILSFNVNPDNMITKYSLGFFCEGSFENAVDFIQNLDNEKINHFGKNSLNYVTEFNNINNSVRLYHEILSGLNK